jgi:hypothetical protein
MATPPAAAAAPPPVRLRLVFDSGRLLRRGQRDDGLRRCWLLVRPELATIADLASHVADRFRLGRSCPRGVVLSVGAATPSSSLDSFPSFVLLPLPPFPLFLIETLTHGYLMDMIFNLMDSRTNAYWFSHEH